MVVTAHNIHSKPGYKQTEVGLIPEDWEVKMLGDLVVNFFNGGTPSTQRSEYWQGNIPWITGADIVNQRIDVIRRYISKEAVNNSATSVVDKGSLLLVTRTGVGKMTIAPFNVAISQDITGIHVNDKMDVEYLFRFFDFNSSRLKELNQGTSIAGITRETLTTTLVAYPSTKAEQQAIAAALSDVDALIASLDQLIAKKRDIKQATMQQLLTGKTQLPGFSGEWEVKKLGEIADIISGGTPSTTITTFWNGNIKWCTPTDITRTKGKYLTDTAKCISETGLKYSSANLLPVGSLLLCSRATIGEIKIAADIVCTNQGFKSLICTKAVNNEFLYYVVLTIKPKLVEKAIGSTFLEISKKDIALIEIALPPLFEQQAIATILTDMDAEIVALEERREKTRVLKQGMMQELLTGKTRLLS